LDFGARRLARRLTALKIDHVHEEFEDDHYSKSYRFDVSFPRLFAALSEGGPAAGWRLSGLAWG
jgi:hypothetical protein